MGILTAAQSVIGDIIKVRRLRGVGRDIMHVRSEIAKGRYPEGFIDYIVEQGPQSRAEAFQKGIRNATNHYR